MPATQKKEGQFFKIVPRVLGKLAKISLWLILSLQEWLIIFLLITAKIPSKYLVQFLLASFHQKDKNPPPQTMKIKYTKTRKKSASEKLFWKWYTWNLSTDSSVSTMLIFSTNKSFELYGRHM